MAFLSTFADGSAFSLVRSLINSLVGRANGTGWGNYTDGTYTSASPFALAANTDTNLPNDKTTVIETQKPQDVTTFYDGTYITGRNGDGLSITIDFKAKPSSGSTTYLECWIDIGGSVGELYRRIITFPKGNGVERPVNFTVDGYTLDTWQSNGGVVKVRADGTCDIYDIRYVLTRTHQAR